MLEVRHHLREFLEFPSAPPFRDAAKTGHALRHVGLESDALLLAVIADIDAGRFLFLHDVANRLVHLGRHLGGVEGLAGFRRMSRSESFSLRGRLPTWVVRIRSRLAFMIALSPFHRP